LALVQAVPLFGDRELEVADHDSRTRVCCGLSQGGPFVPTPQAVVDDDVDAQSQGTHPDLDQPALDHIRRRNRVVAAVKGLHPLIFGEAKGSLLFLDPSCGGRLTDPRKPDDQVQSWLLHRASCG
jgi:hypothetical protein